MCVCVEWVGGTNYEEDFSYEKVLDIETVDEYFFEEYFFKVFAIL